MLPPGGGFSKAQLSRDESADLIPACLPSPKAGRATTRVARKSPPKVEIGQWAAAKSPPLLTHDRNQCHHSKLNQRFERAADRRSKRLERWAMTILKWALLFLLVSIVAGILGFTDISAVSADIARFLFYVFVVIFLVLLILGLTIFRV
jgi:uncharacterized membrane protein YtjA (UPF0391 family)